MQSETKITAKTQRLIDRKQILDKLRAENKIIQEEYEQKSKLLSNIII